MKPLPWCGFQTEFGAWNQAKMLPWQGILNLMPLKKITNVAHFIIIQGLLIFAIYSFSNIVLKPCLFFCLLWVLVQHLYFPSVTFFRLFMLPKMYASHNTVKSIMKFCTVITVPLILLRAFWHFKACQKHRLWTFIVLGKGKQTIHLSIYYILEQDIG